MHILGSIYPRVLNSIAFGSALAAIERWFTRFDSVVNSFGEFTNNVVLDVDFECEFKVVGGSDTTGRILGQVGSFSNEIGLNSDNSSLRFRAGGGSLRTLSFDTALDRTKVNTISVLRAGSVISTVVNGIPQASTTPTTAALVFDVLARASSSYNNGYIYDLKIWAGGDRNTGTLVVNSPMDDAPTATEFANLADPANPIIKRNIADTQTALFDQVADGWTGPELSDTGAVYVKSDAFDERVFVNYEASVVYRCSADVFDYVSGSVSLKYANGDTLTNAISSNGLISGSGASTGAGTFLEITGAATLCSMTNVSLKEFLEVAS